MEGVLEFLARAGPIAIGGGTVQLAIFLLRRRSEVRQLDAVAKKTDVESASVVVASATDSVALANLLRDQAIERAKLLEDELEQIRVQVAFLTAEVAKANRALARAKASNDVLRNQIQQLTRGSPDGS